MIDAVLFDLDDTLFEQRHWLAGAWAFVAEEAADRFGHDPLALRRALEAVAAEGSGKGRIIDRALLRIGAPGTPVGPLVDAFRAYRAEWVPAWPGAATALAQLREDVPVALVTDGDPAIQRAKLTALGMTGSFDALVFSDELGRSYRKPHPAPFRLALERLGVDPGRVVHVGDRPDKDVAGAAAAGIRAVRVATGEYRAMPDMPHPWARAPHVTAAIALLRHGQAPLCPS